MKKSTPKSDPAEAKRPKTELDERFLSAAVQVMKSHGIASDRAISIELGRNPDFINKVRRGLQSATPEAWDTLLKKYPEARHITNISITAKDGGPAIGNVEGNVTTAPNNLNDCQRELAAAQKEIALLTSQLADKERTIQILLKQTSS